MNLYWILFQFFVQVIGPNSVTAMTGRIHQTTPRRAGFITRYGTLLAHASARQSHLDGAYHQAGSARAELGAGTQVSAGDDAAGSAGSQYGDGVRVAGAACPARPGHALLHLAAANTNGMGDRARRGAAPDGAGNGCARGFVAT